MDRPPQNKTASGKSRAVALLLMCSLLAGLLLGSGLTRKGNSPVGLSESLITQLILQDVCHGHPSEAQPFAVPQSAQSAAYDQNNPPPASGHTHCAACLLALDIHLPQRGGTWRLKADELGLERPFVPFAARQVNAPFKPPSHAPPLPV